MTPRNTLVAVAVFALSTLGLGACQTTPAPAPTPASPPAVKPAEVKPVEEAKPISTETARNLANNCFTCHGPGGRSPGTIPSINTMKAETIATRMKNFKSGAEPSTVMGRQAKGYSDAEIEAVAKYISGLMK